VHIAQADQLQHLADALLPLGGGQVREAEGHVVGSVEMRKQRVILEHHADAAGLGRQYGRRRC
jgi:hypothetical protein